MCQLEGSNGQQGFECSVRNGHPRILAYISSFLRVSQPTPDGVRVALEVLGAHAVPPRSIGGEA